MTLRTGFEPLFFLPGYTTSWQHCEIQKKIVPITHPAAQGPLTGPG